MPLLQSMLTIFGGRSTTIDTVYRQSFLLFDILKAKEDFAVCEIECVRD